MCSSHGSSFLEKFLLDHHFFSDSQIQHCFLVDIDIGPRERLSIRGDIQFIHESNIMRWCHVISFWCRHSCVWVHCSSLFEEVFSCVIAHQLRTTFSFRSSFQRKLLGHQAVRDHSTVDEQRRDESSWIPASSEKHWLFSFGKTSFMSRSFFGSRGTPRPFRAPSFYSCAHFFGSHRTSTPSIGNASTERAFHVHSIVATEKRILAGSSDPKASDCGFSVSFFPKQLMKINGQHCILQLWLRDNFLWHVSPLILWSIVQRQFESRLDNEIYRTQQTLFPDH